MSMVSKFSVHAHHIHTYLQFFWNVLVDLNYIDFFEHFDL